MLMTLEEMWDLKDRRSKFDVISNVFEGPAKLLYNNTMHLADFHSNGPDYRELQNPNANGKQSRFKKGFYWVGTLAFYYDGEQFHDKVTLYYDVNPKHAIDQLKFEGIK